MSRKDGLEAELEFLLILYWFLYVEMNAVILSLGFVTYSSLWALGLVEFE